MGDKAAKVSDFHGFALPNQTLSESFSMDSFVATLARLNSLRVLSLVSLGIWGQLPDKIHRLSSLEYLDMSSNFLFGSIPPKISTVPNWFDSLSNLTILSLRNNQFKSSNDMSGESPHLSSLNSLRVLDLSANKLHSMLPEMPKGVVMVFLSNNSFLGEIPQQYARLSQLQHLDMSFNMLRGKTPTELFSLPNITYLNIASNMVSGSLPDHLSCGRKLEFVDISNNRLMGGLPSCLNTKSEKRVVKFDGNCLAIDTRHQHEKPYCVAAVAVSMKKQSKRKNVEVLVGVTVGIFVVMALLSFGFLFLWRRYRPPGISEQHLLQKTEQNTSAAGFSSELLANASRSSTNKNAKIVFPLERKIVLKYGLNLKAKEQFSIWFLNLMNIYGNNFFSCLGFVSEAAKLGMQGLPVCRSFTLEELKEATNNFDNSAFMGEGSCGKVL